MNAEGALPKASWRQWVALAVLCLPTMLVTVDVSVTILALPDITHDLGSSDIQQLWITDIYGFLIAGFLITMGTLGDRIGRRKVLLGGATLFIAASVLAAYATSTGMLIGARALIGIAGATIMPSVLALIAAMFPNPKEMGAAMGMWGSSIMIGLIGGPIVGGTLLGAFWWGSIFLIAVPIMGLLLLIGPFLLPEFRNPQAGRLDLPSVVLSLATIMLIIYGIKGLGRDGWGVLPVTAVVVGLLLAFVFLQRQRTISSPLLDLSLFKNRTLASGFTLGLLIAVIMGGIGLTTAMYMQMVKGMSALSVALWLILPSAAMVVLGNMGVALAQKIRPAYILTGGAVIAVAGLVVLTTVSSTGSLALLMTGLVLVYVGGSPVGMMNGFLVMSSAPPEKAGSAGSVSSTAGELGAALGVAVLGVVGTALYRNDMTVPSSVPAEQTEAAGSSLAGAVSVAGQLPGAAGGDLLEGARQAFTTGMHGVALCAMLLFAALAAVAFFGLRHVPPTGQQGPPPGAPEAAGPDAAEPEAVDTAQPQAAAAPQKEAQPTV
jgi:MFS transporter, DHA2 family, multidrug resistance protein